MICFQIPLFPYDSEDMSIRRSLFVVALVVSGMTLWSATKPRELYAETCVQCSIFYMNGVCFPDPGNMAGICHEEQHCNPWWLGGGCWTECGSYPGPQDCDPEQHDDLSALGADGALANLSVRSSEIDQLRSDCKGRIVARTYSDES